MRSILSFACVLLSSMPMPASGQTLSLRQEIEALHAAMVADFNRDPASVAKHYSDDASILGMGSRYVGREQVHQYWRQSPAGARWSLEVVETGGDVNAPWVRGRSTLQSASGRRMETEYIGILKRQADGRLRFYLDMYVPANPAPAAR